MSDDLVKELRKAAHLACFGAWDDLTVTVAKVAPQAADTIESLTRELDAARAWPIEAQDIIVLLTRQLEERAKLIVKLEADNARLRKALGDIAVQKLYREITLTDPDELDWLGVHEVCVNRARKALEDKGP